LPQLFLLDVVDLEMARRPVGGMGDGQRRGQAARGGPPDEGDAAGPQGWIA
jgi:hypothetical protein